MQATALALARQTPSHPNISHVEVFVVGQKDELNVSIGCYRIPALVRTSAGTLLAFAEGLEEALQPYRARVLEVEQQLERTPDLSLAALQLGFAEWELALPALCQLLDVVQAAPPEAGLRP